MIRLILFVLALLLVAISSLIAFPISLLIGLFSKNNKDRFSLGYVKFALRLFLLCAGAKVQYIGLENLPKQGESVVYIGNHRSFFDVIATYPVMPTLTGFIAKKEMHTWPVVSWWMKNVYCLFLDRKNHREGIKTILEGIQNVKNGVSMVIFPEGTRSRQEGHVAAFHNGSFKLATKSGAKIVPVVYNNSSAIWEDHLPWMHSAVMTVEFCKPIETAGLSVDEQTELVGKVHDIILKKHLENGKALGSLPEDIDND